MKTMLLLALSVFSATFVRPTQAAGQHLSVADAPKSSAAQTVGTSSASETVVPAERNPRYKICVEDKLALSFPLSPEMDQKVLVQPDGYITLRGAGSLHVVGLTVTELVAAVKSAFEPVLQEPLVNVDLEEFHKPFFTVLGQVGKPGQYDLRYDTKVTEAVALAGGFASTAKTQVLLYRAGSSMWVEVRQLNIKEILNGKNINEDVYLRPGDMIFVPEKGVTKFRKYVPYGFGTGISTTF